MSIPVRMRDDYLQTRLWQVYVSMAYSTRQYLSASESEAVSRAMAALSSRIVMAEGEALVRYSDALLGLTSALSMVRWSDADRHDIQGAVRALEAAADRLRGDL